MPAFAPLVKHISASCSWVGQDTPLGPAVPAACGPRHRFEAPRCIHPKDPPHPSCGLLPPFVPNGGEGRVRGSLSVQGFKARSSFSADSHLPFGHFSPLGTHRGSVSGLSAGARRATPEARGRNFVPERFCELPGGWCTDPGRRRQALTQTSESDREQPTPLSRPGRGSNPPAPPKPGFPQSGRRHP
jgi:hypothetical protein